MAIAFASVSIHTRAKGHSAVAASAYRTASKLYDERTGQTYDYSKRHAVIYTTLLLPDGCNSKFENREFLWNQAEFAEKRRDAQISKDVVLALPKEITLEQQIELTKRFAKIYFVENGLPADIAIHDHGEGNPHAHILISTRRLEKNGFSKYKARDLNPGFAKGFVVEKDYWGERWREFQNDFFIEKNIDLVVDLNHLIPEPKRGKIKESTSNYLLERHQDIKHARIELASDNAENIIEQISKNHSVFTRRDVEKLIFKIFKDNSSADDYLTIIECVMAHKDVIKLGANDKGKICYTTRKQYMEEASLRVDIEKMMRSNNHIFSKNIDGLANQYSLNEEQTIALNYITKNSDISVVIGRPGTGKSYLLNPVKEYYEANNCEVIGAALSGKVAKSLQNETGIKTSTVASLNYKLEKGMFKLTSKHIVIIDEAGMVDFNNMSLLLNKASKAGSKVILVGDPDQLKPINKGEIFRGIAEITGYIELDQITRQRDLKDREASLNLAHGKIDEAVAHYQAKNAVHFKENSEEASQQLIDDWQQDVSKETLKDSILLAFTRKAVSELNLKAREALQTKGMLSTKEITRLGFDKELKLAEGERLLFRENNYNLGVRNGDLGTVTKAEMGNLQVKFDSGAEVKVPRSYQALDYGYALTVHKSQGMTTEHTKVLIDSQYWDRHLSFVAMTRHKESLHIYADKINHSDINALTATMKRSITKDNVIDWPLNYAIKKGFNPDKLIGKVINHIASVGNKIRNGFNYVVNYEGYLLESRQKDNIPDKTKLFKQAKIFAETLDHQQAVAYKKQPHLNKLDTKRILQI